MRISAEVRLARVSEAITSGAQLRGLSWWASNIKVGGALLWACGVPCIENTEVRTQTLEGKRQKETASSEDFYYVLQKS